MLVKVYFIPTRQRTIKLTLVTSQPHTLWQAFTSSCSVSTSVSQQAGINGLDETVRMRFITPTSLNRVPHSIKIYRELCGIICTRHTITWTGQDYPTGNSSRRKTKRQTEKTMGRQHQRMDWPSMEHHTTESWEPRGVEEAGCKIFSGAPTVSQTTG